MILKLDSSKLSTLTNTVEVVGTISTSPLYTHDYDGVKYYSIKVDALRYGDRYDVIHVFITQEDMIVDGILLDVGLKVAIEGYLVQSKLKKMNDISVVATSIKVAKLTDSDKNQVYLGGHINKLFDLRPVGDTEKVIKNFICKHSSLTDGKEIKLNAKVVTWNSIARLIDKEYDEGNAVLLKGQIESKLVKQKGSNIANVKIHELAVSLVFRLREEDVHPSTLHHNKLEQLPEVAEEASVAD